MKPQATTCTRVVAAHVMPPGWSSLNRGNRELLRGYNALPGTLDQRLAPPVVPLVRRSPRHSLEWHHRGPSCASMESQVRSCLAYVSGHNVTDGSVPVNTRFDVHNLEREVNALQSYR